MNWDGEGYWLFRRLVPDFSVIIPNSIQRIIAAVAFVTPKALNAFVRWALNVGTVIFKFCACSE